MFRGASHKLLRTDLTPWTSGCPSVRSGLCRAPGRVRRDEHGEVGRTNTTPNEWGTLSRARVSTPEILVQIWLLGYGDGMVIKSIHIFTRGTSTWRADARHGSAHARNSRLNEEKENAGIGFNEPVRNLAIRHTMTNSSSSSSSSSSRKQQHCCCRTPTAAA